MLKKITIIGLLSFALAVAFNANANADDRDRINLMEKEIQEIKVRLSELESLLSNPSKAQELVPSGGGWKSVANWRKLTTDMGASDVQKILGEPLRVNGGNLATWYYQNDGEVVFYRGKVNQWTEPRH